jgi:predicted CopG family antitoxin
MSKLARITDETYARLEKHRRPSETRSDVVERLLNDYETWLPAPDQSVKGEEDVEPPFQIHFKIDEFIDSLSKDVGQRMYDEYQRFADDVVAGKCAMEVRPSCHRRDDPDNIEIEVKLFYPKEAVPDFEFAVANADLVWIIELRHVYCVQVGDAINDV